ncbi:MULTISPECIES: ABC transporter ATP-binding protein [Desulfococcus]|uniref:ABC transporter related protein n=1 Tax=Desulfococcus multivorans DSM 2059 TaxID=1121405 RepID=S7U1K3_DESML|nr:ABC transporter ATP-binding protein [Desulfococcus multivorans]AOY58408.1 wtpC: molybdate/tungstade transport system, ATP-binding protein [Desulfococcus multivorans]AQV00732.1 Fe3+/spermidine/putrescine ABC transporter ATP-binding protein [Desulfococcus multivorans]EPR43197.1 ABC transporter related protein [Desulfococcus multivorans DSM 2059]SJZ39987.1 tungstate/molybdate transport system ATP-binding protein [Desulfococcus multivorans DSM 2059]
MIAIQNLHIALGDFRLSGIDLEIGANEFFVLMGPTGAGKTLLLEAIAGLVPVKSGKIILNEKDVTRLPPEKRFVGIVYQDYALFPHLTVEKNITYGHRYAKRQKKALENRLDYLLDTLDLTHLQHRLPLNLSGGERQRTALARALMVNPGVLLLDEPLSALDPHFREEIRNTLKKLHTASPTTFMMVTHDFVDALSLGNRAAVMSRGRIEQVGRVEEIFQRPVSRFVADFVGMKNLFRANFVDTKAFAKSVEVTLAKKPAQDSRYIALRPEDVAVSLNAPESSGGKNCYKGTVMGIVDQGFSYEIHTAVGALTFKSLMTKRLLFELSIKEGKEVYLAFDASAVHTL